MRHLSVFAALLLSGCGLGMHFMPDTLENRVVAVEGMDRFYFNLPEDASVGAWWSAKSDDDDAEVTIDHGSPIAKARVRIHRGFDGPATVVFSCTQKSGVPPKPFQVLFYKSTGDRSFWE